MEYSSNLALFFILKIKKHRIMVRNIVLRIEILKLIDSEMSCHRLHSRSRTVLLALERISGNMRCSHINKVDEFLVHIRFVVPGVDDRSSQLRINFLQRSLIHDLSARSVDEYGTWKHLSEEFLISHAPGSLIERRMHSHNLCIGKEIFQRAEALITLCCSARRIASENIETEISGHCLHFLSHMSHSNDAEIGSIQLYILSCRHAIKRREDILHHSAGIAALSIIHLYVVIRAILQIDMVHSDGSRRNHTDLGAIEKVSIALGSCPDDQSISIEHVLACDLSSINIDHFRIRLEDTLEKRYILICYNFHNIKFISCI